MAERHSPITTKGDLMVGDTNGNVMRLGVGANGTILSPDNTQTSGLKWDTPPFPTTSSFNSFSQSIHDFTSSVIRDSASFDTRINSVSGGGISAGIFNPFSQSIHNWSSSINSYTASAKLDSASFESTIRFFSSSYAAFTQSYFLDSASFNSRINLKTDQTVFVAYSQSINVWTRSIDDKTGSFASTSSNNFIGNQTITGSISISGSLILRNTKYENFQTGSISGSNVLASTLTSSYNSIFYNYLLISSSNLRAGQIMAIWSASVVQFNEYVTNDIGNTSTASFSVIISASYVNLMGNIPQSNWTIKTNFSLL